MNKTELIEKVAFDMGLKRAESKEIVEHIFSIMADSLAAGEDVSIVDFCSFRIKDRPARRYRHNGTGKKMEVPAGKRIKVSMSENVLRRVDPSYELENVQVDEE